MGSEQTTRTVKAVETSCSILKALQALDGAGVTELANHLNLAKSSVHAHLATLEENELIVSQEAEYRLGFQFLEYGEYVKAQSRLFQIAKDEIRNLQRTTGELAHLMVEERGRAVFIIREDGPEAVHITASRAGNREWMHCTSVGKAVLAHISPDRLEWIVHYWGLPELTDNTITDFDVLRDELSTIRDQGFAIDDQERLKGFRGVAVPLFDRDDVVIGAISVSGPVSRFKGEVLHEQFPEALADTANIIEVKLSYA